MTPRAFWAVFRKEYKTEFRTPSGLWIALLFGVMAVFALAAASFNEKLNGSLAAGLLWVSLLFGNSISLPRRFVTEEEARTGDLLRLSTHPHAVYWGKTVFSVLESLIFALGVSVLFLVLTSVNLLHPGLYVFGVFGSSLCISGTLSICSAIGAQSKNRLGLASAIALPLIAPVIFLGVSCLRVAMGDGGWDGGVRSGVGLLGYGVCSLTVGPYLFAAVWKR